jgi:mono/diheme cytochrome c family protein
MRRMRLCTPWLLCPALLSLAVAGCDLPTPMAPAEPIGEVPKWGEGFGVPKQAPASALGGSQDPGEAAKSPGDTGDWSGGDATLGKGVWIAMCARCHGDNGEGGAMPDGKPVLALNDPAWQEKTSDRLIARAIALGKEPMPSFMKELDRAKLQGVVAYIRTLKRK